MKHKSDDWYTPSNPLGRNSSRVNIKLKKTRLFSNGLMAELDRDNISPRRATRLVAATACALGEEVNDIHFSKSTFHRKRGEFRQKLAGKIRANFQPPKRAIMHFDGKIMTDNNRQCGDILAVMISGDTDECRQGKLLSARMIEDGTGRQQALEVQKTVDKWGVLESVVGISFDTTSSNTGKTKGAAKLIEDLLDKVLLWLACRHHIGELYIKAAHCSIYEDDTSPYYMMFDSFCDHWHELDKNRIHFMMERVAYNDHQIFQEKVAFCQDQLARYHPRDDYKEFLELVLVTLGSRPRNFTFKIPGAYNKARWLCVCIYMLKIFLFRGQLGLSRAEECNLERLCRFICLVYVEWWFVSPTARNAPVMDLKLHKTMVSYLQVDQEIAEAVLDKINKHTWYLTDRFIPFCLFSELISDEEKQEIALALINVNPPLEYKGGKPEVVQLSSTENVVERYRLSQFIKSGSHYIFDVLGFDKTWLDQPVANWRDYEGYLEAEKFVNSLLVVNDAAERGIKLISEYINKLTKDPDERQDLIQVVQYHRSVVGDDKKSSIQASFHDFNV